MSYLDNNLMTRGFGLLAYPADYGKSGIMTFLVNQRGLVYEKDLGRATEDVARQITTYSPDGTWYAVTESGL